jgi:hypothetical protein
MVADLQHFDEEQDPNLHENEKFDPDPQKSKEFFPDWHQGFFFLHIFKEMDPENQCCGSVTF